MTEQYIGMSIAVIVVTASIVLAGIVIGVGRAFGYRRLENFGVEELVQSVINAAVIGGIASVIALISSISASVVTEKCGIGDAPAQLSCMLTGVQSALFSLFQESIKALDILGYYQSLVLDFTAFSIQPFANLSSISNVLASQVFMMQLLTILIGLNIHMLEFVTQNALALLFPIGLVLRTFFVSRKAGGFIIALAIGLYLFYPSFILIFPNPEYELLNATVRLENFTNNSLYATIPVIDLNSNYAIAGKLDMMSGRCGASTSGTNITNSSCAAYASNYTANMANLSADFTGDLTMISQSNSGAISKTLLYSAIAPLLSLLVTLVFVKEAGELLGSEIGISTFSAI